MIKARTTGRAKRAVKRAVIPGYGKRGMGFVKNLEEFFSCGNAQFGSIFFIWEQLKCSRMKKMLPLCHVVVVTPE